MATDTQNQKMQQIYDYSLINSLELLPGGERISLLKSKLNWEQLATSSHYILEIMLSFVFLSLNSELQTVISNLIQKDDYEDAILLIYGLCNNSTAEAQILQLELLKGLDLGFRVMCKKYNLEF